MHPPGPAPLWETSYDISYWIRSDTEVDILHFIRNNPLFQATAFSFQNDQQLSVYELPPRLKFFSRHQVCKQVVRIPLPKSKQFGF